tara:strand:+ start:940 stop:1608 length:669 start_codon:yes stop_codon:yes gene_type:complete
MLVAEIGLNHFGSEKIANQFIDRLLKTDIDAITFQVAGNEFYKKNRKLKLPNSFYLSAIKKVHSGNKKIGLAFGDCCDYEKYNKYNYDFFKFLSIATKKMVIDYKLKNIDRSIFLSIGMVDEIEITKILKKIPNNHITLLYTSFSQKTGKLDLRIIKKIKKKFQLPVAYGQHAYSTKILNEAKSMGSDDIFFYVKRDIKRIHPDEKNAIKISQIDKVIKNLK